MRYRYILLAVICAWIFLFFADLPSVYADAGKIYRIAYLKQFYPFQFEKNGVPSGYVIDLMNKIADEEQVEFKWVPMDLKDALKALENHQVDAIAGLKYTAERNKSFDFSEAFMTVSHNLIVPYDNQTILSLANLGNKVVAVESGNVAIELLKNIRGVKVIVAKDQGDAFHLMVRGRADAFLGNSIFSEAYMKQNKLESKYKIINSLILPSDYALATFKGNDSFLAMINRGSIQIRANQQYQVIYNKWFGQYNSQLATRLKIVIQILSAALIVFLLYLYFTVRWNRKLKKEVDHRTKELQEINQILAGKIVEEQKLRTQLIHREKMQTLGHLVAGIAHEIRNPLTSIQAFVEMIPAKFENSKFREEISRFVPNEIDRLNRIVTDLLDYAKPRKSRRETFEIVQCVDSILPMLQSSLSKKEITIMNHIEAKNVAYADYEQIKQVLLNVLINAVDSIDQSGKIMLHSTTEDEQVRITIRDTGKGIKGDQLQKIFEPFYTNKAHGTGLGLSLSLDYLRDNNGDLQIESEWGIGTTVTLILPIKGDNQDG